MTARRWPWVAVVAIACGVSGCLGASETGSRADRDEPDAAVMADAGAVDDVSDTAPDVAGGADAGPAPFFELGWNLTGKSTPDSFTPLADGAPLAVEFGPQGLWMVVLSFRTRGLLVEPLFLDGRIEVHDHPAGGELALKGQKLLPGPDGVRYYYNFWLVVDDPEGVGGHTATVSMFARDADGLEHEVRVDVVLTGGANG